MDVSIFSDPVKIGPGIWFKMHTDAVGAINDKLKESFEININITCDNFKCKKCQGHFRKFIDIYPLRNYWNIYDMKGRDIGFFKWTWELHNQVNKFLSKYQPTLEEAYEFFSNSETGACFNCGDSSSQDKQVRSSDELQLRDTTEGYIHSGSSIQQEKIQLSEQISRAIPPILTLYRQSGEIKPQPFKLIPRN